MKGILTGFRTFLFRGNIIDLAVAVVIGVAFAALVDTFVKGMLTPLIAAIFGEPSFSDLTFTINDATFFYGAVLDELITFICIVAAIYFFVVVPVNAMVERSRRGEATPDATTRSCPECLSEIPMAARRCAFCTTELGSSPATGTLSP
jgi:large conductance mechanosensitive channel